MFDFDDGASEREKCFTTVTQLPAFVDPKQIPSKKSPFSTILNHPLTHTVEVILPEAVYTSIQSSLDAKLTKPRYARVFMSPADILDGDFFNTYIKSGNVIMISEGRSGSDIVFTLREGICKIELGKEIYERTGLNGKSIRSGGRKHEKERFLIELNLRLPSMLHGKKGFERIVWAFKNVLNQSLTWLFCDLDPASQDDESKPIKGLHPQLLESAPAQAKLKDVLTPPLQELVSSQMPEAEMQERCVDPYLSRYSVPEFDKNDTVDLVSLKWRGFISSAWTMQLFLTLMSSTAKLTSVEPSSWFVISSSALDRQAVEGRDGFSIAVSPNILSSTTGIDAKAATEAEAETETQDPEASALNTRHAICWEFVGASALHSP
ncbi:hypothetical protein N7509_010540 [Penicillium cosmopolitanum]|uniref:Uncharacterized protein n=1 Tax=Penicillium cosmopolitanum TaxID=1131564 RepID=A0A9W9VRM8_9EURO|nr:uncharacterized protein N7509_010540 [Penicillium cosmopolitanum]KAJ5387999.1 hypothetical protein N7509_010540 [Penicillium cosmopolitanum]